ncbi:hypothetical protein NPS70_24675 [Streptomyces sp. C10-9-1]|uniref:hypothetical protein n=1 Tax=Streptomyces sp. C10-9-1 TaxID=1859285 RepID=UPI0021132CAC|nr:hypothetical protein [Streptomyces sp. C10-9-1]MCQ6556351.1 hypothetical protein [Streptomyces sp. C10-9-1]
MNAMHQHMIDLRRTAREAEAAPPRPGELAGRRLLGWLDSRRAARRARYRAADGRADGG